MLDVQACPEAIFCGTGFENQVSQLKEIGFDAIIFKNLEGGTKYSGTKYVLFDTLADISDRNGIALLLMLPCSDILLEQFNLPGTQEQYLNTMDSFLRQADPNHRCKGWVIPYPILQHSFESDPNQEKIASFFLAVRNKLQRYNPNSTTIGIADLAYEGEPVVLKECWKSFLPKTMLDVLIIQVPYEKEEIAAEKVQGNLWAITRGADESGVRLWSMVKLSQGSNSESLTPANPLPVFHTVDCLEHYSERFVADPVSSVLLPDTATPDQRNAVQSLYNSCRDRYQRLRKTYSPSTPVFTKVPPQPPRKTIQGSFMQIIQRGKVLRRSGFCGKRIEPDEIGWYRFTHSRFCLQGYRFIPVSSDYQARDQRGSSGHDSL